MVWASKYLGLLKGKEGKITCKIEYGAKRSYLAFPLLSIVDVIFKTDQQILVSVWEDFRWQVSFGNWKNIQRKKFEDIGEFVDPRLWILHWMIRAQWSTVSSCFLHSAADWQPRIKENFLRRVLYEELEVKCGTIVLWQMGEVRGSCGTWGYEPFSAVESDSGLKEDSSLGSLYSSTANCFY